MFRTLDERNAHAKPTEKLGELDRDSATAENDQGARERLELNRFVTGDVTDFIERGHRRRGLDGAGGDDEIFRANFLAVGKRERVRTCEFSVGADEIETLAFQLGFAVIGEFLDEAIFAGDDFLEVERNVAGANTDRRTVLDEMENFCGLEERFGGHATAENA